MGRPYVALIVCVSLFTAGISQAAENEDKAKEYYLNGLEKLKQEDYKGAAEAFELSTDAFPNPNCLYNLALSYYKLDRYMDSLKTFDRLKSEFPNSMNESDDTVITETVAEIEKILPRLTLIVQPDSAVVRIDGDAAGTPPYQEAIVLAPGAHQIEISKEGYETASQAITLKKGESRKETFVLNELEQVPADTVSTLDPNTQPDDISATKKPAKKSSLFPLKYNSILLITGGVGTGVMAGLSIGLWAAGVNRLKDNNNKNDTLEEDWDEDLRASQATDKKRAEALNTAAVVTTVIAGVFAALTATELVLKMNKKKGPLERVSATPDGLVVKF